MSLPFSIDSPSKSSATSATLPAAMRGARVTSIGSPESSSSPVMWISISASFKVPAACMALKAATITTMPPLSSPAPGPSACSPLRTNFWNGLSGSNTVSRCAMSSSFLVPFLPDFFATRWPDRLALVMSIHSTLKPNGSNSARIISDTAFTPAKFIVPLFWFTSFSSRATERSYSASIVLVIFDSCAVNCAEAGVADINAAPNTARVKGRKIIKGSR